jgi:type IV secretion system protein VirB8
MSPNDLEAYFREAASWDASRLASADRATRNARRLAGLFAILAIAALLAVATLTPLKTVEPYLIRVDNTSGVIDTVPNYAGDAPLSESVSRYLLSHYVSTCERFALAIAEQDYAECGAFHSTQRNQQWALLWTPGNPDSPVNRYRDGTTVNAEVKAVSFFQRGTGAADLAQVRFARNTQPGGGGATQTTHYIATIQYAYGKPPADPKTRRWNPIGFRILDYRIEPEIPTSTPTTALAATTATP